MTENNHLVNLPPEVFAQIWKYTKIVDYDQIINLITKFKEIKPNLYSSLEYVSIDGKNLQNRNLETICRVFARDLPRVKLEFFAIKFNDIDNLVSLVTKYKQISNLRNISILFEENTSFIDQESQLFKIINICKASNPNCRIEFVSKTSPLHTYILKYEDKRLEYSNTLIQNSLAEYLSLKIEQKNRFENEISKLEVSTFVSHCLKNDNYLIAKIPIKHLHLVYSETKCDPEKESSPLGILFINKFLKQGTIERVTFEFVSKEPLFLWEKIDFFRYDNINIYPNIKEYDVPIYLEEIPLFVWSFPNVKKFNIWLEKDGKDKIISSETEISFVPFVCPVGR